MERKEKMERRIRIGTRKSNLALAQTQIVMDRIKERRPDWICETVLISTEGDRILDIPLCSFGGKGAFVSALEEALKKNEIDIAVHSAKDMPAELLEGLTIGAVLKREDPRDVLVTKKGTDFKEIGNVRKPVIGTGSLRRQIQVQKLFPCVCKNLRGNVNTRLRKLSEGEYDGIILAAAGLARLFLLEEEGYDYRYFTTKEMVPAGGQGILAIEGRKEKEWQDLYDLLEDKEGRALLDTERAALAFLGADCSAPYGIYSTIEEGNVSLRIFFDKNGLTGIKEESAPIGGHLELAGKISENILKQTGFVYLAGAGPGELGLLTLKAKEVLSQCEVLIYDRLASMDCLSFAPEGCEKIYVGKRTGGHTAIQEEINRLLVEKALEGKRVVRLKGGDPYVFGRGGEEAEALKEAGISYEVIPGVTSAIAALSYAGIPVTSRGYSRSFHVITGHTKGDGSEEAENYGVLAKLEGTLIFLMGMENLHKITTELLKAGKAGDTPAAIISNGTTSRQKTIRSTLSGLEAACIENKMVAPAVIVIGGVASLNLLGAGKPEGALLGVRIGVTGTKVMADKLQKKLKVLGGTVEDLSFLKVERTQDRKVFLQELNRIAAYQWVVFTSANSVRIFFEEWKHLSKDFRELCQVKFAAVGNGTAEVLKDFGFITDYMPPVFSTECLAKGMLKEIKEGERVLVPRAENGSTYLTKYWDENGVAFKEIIIYRIVIDEEKKKQSLLKLPTLDYITFESSSGAKGLLKGNGEFCKSIGEKIKVVCIGDVTATALEEYGIKKKIVAEEYTVEGIVEAIENDVRKG